MKEQMPRTDTEAIALLRAGTAACQEGLVYMETAKSSLERHQPKREPTYTVLAKFLRAMHWMGTLRRMCEPSDFQAGVSATRALFEMNVDLKLLTADRKNHPVEKLRAWEDSAKLKRVKISLEYQTKNPLFVVPSSFAPFVAANETQIQALRHHYWPGSKGKHPRSGRWTGNDLREDSAAAGLEDYYVERYAELCWNTHGSGVVGVRHLGTDDFPALLAIALHDSAKFGVECARLALEYMGAFDAIAERRYQRAAAKRTLKTWLAYRQ